MGIRITFRSRRDAVNVYADDKAQAKNALSNYLGITYGALEKAERADSDEYYASPWPGSERGIQEVRTETIPNYGDGDDEVVEIEGEVKPFDSYFV